MTKEEKRLLLVDLCVRLPYEVKGRVYEEVTDGKYDIDGDMIFYDAPFDVILDGINVSTEEIHVVAIGNEDTVEYIETQQTDGFPYTIHDFKPYLRPMSSMTKEEGNEYRMFIDYSYNDFTSESTPCVYVDKIENYINWLNANHFDYRDLIGKGLALEAHEKMYNINEK